MVFTLEHMPTRIIVGMCFLLLFDPVIYGSLQICLQIYYFCVNMLVGYKLDQDCLASRVHKKIGQPLKLQ